MKASKIITAVFAIASVSALSAYAEPPKALLAAPVGAPLVSGARTAYTGNLGPVATQMQSNYTGTNPPTAQDLKAAWDTMSGYQEAWVAGTPAYFGARYYKTGETPVISGLQEFSTAHPYLSELPPIPVMYYGMQNYYGGDDVSSYSYGQEPMAYGTNVYRADLYDPSGPQPAALGTNAYGAAYYPAPNQWQPTNPTFSPPTTTNPSPFPPTNPLPVPVPHIPPSYSSTASATNDYTGGSNDPYIVHPNYSWW